MNVECENCGEKFVVSPMQCTIHQVDRKTGQNVVLMCDGKLYPICPRCQVIYSEPLEEK